jgi:hypothetical protein
MRRPWQEKGKHDGAVAIGLRRRWMHGASMWDKIKAEGDMDRCCNIFQGVGYRKVTSRVNEGGVPVQTQRSKRRGDGK